MDDRAIDKNDLAYWFPKLKSSGVDVPETRIIHTQLPLLALCDGDAVDGLDGFLGELRVACDHFGYPCFLRTGHTSGKHSWKKTCFVEDPERLVDHVAALVEFSAMADFMGLPCRTWAVREFLDLNHYFTAFDGMPVAQEYRLFIEGGNPEPICIHPYWPEDSIWGASREDWKQFLQVTNHIGVGIIAAARRIVPKVVHSFDGRWSLDVAWSGARQKWYCIDMAEMDRSYHWKGCPKAPANQYDDEDNNSNDGFKAFWEEDDCKERWEEK